MNKLDLEKVQEPEIKLLDHRKSKGIPGKSLYVIDYAKACDCVDHNKLWKECQNLFVLAPKSLQMVTVAMELKGIYSLEGKLCPN